MKNKTSNKNLIFKNVLSFHRKKVFMLFFLLVFSIFAHQNIKVNPAKNGFISLLKGVDATESNEEYEKNDYTNSESRKVNVKKHKFNKDTEDEEETKQSYDEKITKETEKEEDFDYKDEKYERKNQQKTLENLEQDQKEDEFDEEDERTSKKAEELDRQEADEKNTIPNKSMNKTKGLNEAPNFFSEKQEIDYENAFDFVNEKKNNLFNEALSLKYAQNTTIRKIRKAVNIFKELGKNSDAIGAQSLHELGDIYFYGVKGYGGINRDKQKAFNCFNQSASLGYGPALHMMSFAYATGFNNIPVNDKIAARYEYLAAIANHLPAIIGIGYRFFYGHGVKKNCELSLKHYRFAAELALRSENAFTHASIQDSDRISSKTLSNWNKVKKLNAQQHEILQYWEQQAKSGDPMSQYELAKMHDEGNIAKQDSEKAAKLYEKAGNSGLPSALRDLGLLYMQGNGVPQNLKKSFECFNKAAELGDPEAQNYMGFIYYFGDLNTFGVERNETKSVEYFVKAASQDYAESLFFLGEMKIKAHSNSAEEPSEKEYLQALRYYQRAADYGYIQAFWREGQLYEAGKGVEYSCNSAVHAYKVVAESGLWTDYVRRGLSLYLEGDIEGSLLAYSLAAEEGYEVAQSNAAWLYYQAKSVDKNTCFFKAQRLFRRAFLQGNSEALYYIADIQLHGKGGVKKNEELAVKTFQKSVSFGDARSLVPLAVMYEHGNSILTRDSVKSEMLYRYSLDRHDADSENLGHGGLPLGVRESIEKHLYKLSLYLRLAKLKLFSFFSF